MAKATSKKSEGRNATAAEVVMTPECQSAVGIASWSGFAGKVDPGEIVLDMRRQIEKIQAGDISSIEARLYAQAVTLETMFTGLARRASQQQYLDQYKTFTTLALKAQAQCRSTLETLAEIKNPRQVAFVAQANIAHQQQVNNAHPTPPSRTEESQTAPNELLEVLDSERLDAGSTGAASRADQSVATVAAVKRAANG